MLLSIRKNRSYHTAHAGARAIYSHYESMEISKPQAQLSGKRFIGHHMTLTLARTRPFS